MTALAVVVLFAAGSVWLHGRRRAHHRVDADVWPWMIDQIELVIRDGRAPSVALLGVAFHGPPVLRAATGPAVDAWRASGDPGDGVRALQRTAAHPWLDRICRTVEVIEALDGDADAALARLRTAAVADTAHERQRRRRLRSLRLAGWVALAPLTAVAAGRLGAVASVIVICAAVGVWGAALAATSSPGVRVFTGR